MEIELNRAAKFYCRDFPQIREILGQINATFTIKKQQEDHIFKIYDPLTKTTSKRIKVRVENGESHLVYIYSRTEEETNIKFDYYQVKDEQIISIFTSLHGQAISVKKVREVWFKENVVFHLDTVEGVGKIFEIEVLEPGVNQSNEVLNGYLKLFQSCLLQNIVGSNEDLVAGKDLKAEY